MAHRTKERIETELERFKEIIEHGRLEHGKKVPIVFKKELAFGRGYSWQNFMRAIENHKDKREKREFTDTIRQLENVIESRLFRGGIKKQFDSGLVKRYMATNTDMLEKKEVIIKDKRTFNKDQLTRLSKLIGKVAEQEDDVDEDE